MNEWLSQLPGGVVYAVPLLAFAESCVFVGLFVSGVFLLSTVALIYAQGENSLITLVLLAYGGALLGDHVGYYIGRFATPLLWQKRWVRKIVVKRKVGYRRFRQILLTSAPWALCIGRLTPPMRSLSPAIAGASGLSPLRFSLYDILACTIWASLLFVLAYGANQI